MLQPRQRDLAVMQRLERAPEASSEVVDRKVRMPAILDRTDRAQIQAWDTSCARSLHGVPEHRRRPRQFDQIRIPHRHRPFGIRRRDRVEERHAIWRREKDRTREWLVAAAREENHGLAARHHCAEDGGKGRRRHAGATAIGMAGHRTVVSELRRAPDLADHLPARVGAAAGRLDRAEEGVQLVEVKLAGVVLNRGSSHLPMAIVEPLPNKRLKLPARVGY